MSTFIDLPVAEVIQLISCLREKIKDLEKENEELMNKIRQEAIDAKLIIRGGGR